MEIIAGVDEAGRGPLSGPVFAAAVILDPYNPIEGLIDSKKISEKQREIMFDIICQNAKAYAIAFATVEEIDQINILQASLLAMQRAIEALPIQPHLALIDGNQTPKTSMPCEAVIKGDETIGAISAASILAKVSRDRICLQHDLKYPGYGFAQHKGYGTKQHIDALKKLGPSEIHRRSFAPVKQLLKQVVE